MICESTQGNTQVMGQKGQFRLTWVGVKIKIIIILFLKSDSGGQSRQNLVHGSKESIRVDLSQCLDKQNVIIIILKPD